MARTNDFASASPTVPGRDSESVSLGGRTVESGGPRESQAGTARGSQDVARVVSSNATGQAVENGGTSHAEVVHRGPTKRRPLVGGWGSARCDGNHGPSGPRGCQSP